jgi:hypothetical protein
VTCPSNYTPVGDGLSAQCCVQSAYKCTRRSANASCASGEVPVEWQGADPACCRPDPAGSCTPPSTPTPNPPSATGGFDLCEFELTAWLCLRPPPPVTLACTRDADCPAHHDCPGGMTRCSEGVCRCPELTQPASAPTSTCSPPSTLVNGQCCTPEAVAAGTCGVSPLSCTGGKVLVSNVCRCPVGTTENTKSGKCETPKPAATKTKAPVKTPTKPKEIVCQKGFHLEGNRCVQDPQPQAAPGLDIRFGIGIGGGGRGGRPGGGGPPKPPAPN